MGNDGRFCNGLRGAVEMAVIHPMMHIHSY